MNGEIQLLAIYEPVEFVKYPVAVQDFRKITNHFKYGIYMYIKLTPNNRKSTTCTWLDSETLDSDRLCPKISLEIAMIS